MITPLTLLPKVKESLFNLTRRAIENATIYNKIVLIHDTMVYPNDNFNQAMAALKIAQLKQTIKQLS